PEPGRHPDPTTQTISGEQALLQNPRRGHQRLAADAPPGPASRYRVHRTRPDDLTDTTWKTTVSDVRTTQRSPADDAKDIAQRDLPTSMSALTPGARCGMADHDLGSTARRAAQCGVIGNAEAGV